MPVHLFDTLDDGRAVHRVTLGAAPGVVLDLLTLGATVHRLEATGGDGVRRNVVLGRADAAGYLAGDDFRGGTVGRYANRIAHGRFDLDGRPVQVGVSDRGHALHGGPDGFHRRLWTLAAHDATSAELTLRSPDGDQGFPGELDARVVVTVDGDRVQVDFEATTSATTVVNLTSHVYWDLDGADGAHADVADRTGRVDAHELTVHADEVVPVDALGIPLGDPVPVTGTGLDLRHPASVGSVVAREDDQVRQAGGLDHHFGVPGTGLRSAAVLTSHATGTTVELSTDQPGLQVYTGAALDPPRSGVALEPQLAPDTPNHPEWPSARLETGETYRARLTWELSRVEV